MSKPKPKSIKTTGASAHTHVIGHEAINEGLVLLLKADQPIGHGGRLKGAFEVINAGSGPYASAIRTVGATADQWTAKALLDRIQAIPGNQKATHIFNGNMLAVADGKAHGVDAVASNDQVSDGRHKGPTDLHAYTSTYREGQATDVTQTRYERNPAARRECLDHYGLACSVCDMDFGSRYGPTAEGFIHVHHLYPLAEAAQQREVHPINELRPVCPNCHAVIHLGGECRSIEKVRVLLRTNP